MRSLGLVVMSGSQTVRQLQSDGDKFTATQMSRMSVLTGNRRIHHIGLCCGVRALGNQRCK
jgi:hypothetical protein